MWCPDVPTVWHSTSSRSYGGASQHAELLQQRSIAGPYPVRPPTTQLTTTRCTHPTAVGDAMPPTVLVQPQPGSEHSPVTTAGPAHQTAWQLSPHLKLLRPSPPRPHAAYSRSTMARRARPTRTFSVCMKEPAHKKQLMSAQCYAHTAVQVSRRTVLTHG